MGKMYDIMCTIVKEIGTFASDMALIAQTTVYF